MANQVHGPKTNTNASNTMEEEKEPTAIGTVNQMILEETKESIPAGTIKQVKTTNPKQRGSHKKTKAEQPSPVFEESRNEMRSFWG